MKYIAEHFNPISRLGINKYRLWPSFLALVFITILSEFFAYSVMKNPLIVGAYIIFVHVALIIYFAFRDGIKGGFMTTFLAIAYYFYIIYTRHYGGQQFVSGVETTIILAVIYTLLAWVIGWLKQTIDILIIREADEKRRLQTIINQLPVGVVITDKDGKVVQANKKIDSILGIKFPLGLQIGKQALLPTKERGRIVAPSQGPLAQVLKSGKSAVEKEYQVIRKDGKALHLQISAVPILNHEGKRIAAVSITSDVTQQKEIESRKDDFLNMASHELKTPLTSMKLYIETFLSRASHLKDEKSVRVINRIKYQTEKLEDLVADLLDVSRIQTGKLVFRKETFSLNDMIDETIQGLQDAAGSHHISFSAPKSIDVYADRFRLYQVLTNLLTNAIKYSPEESTIKVRLTNSGNKATVSVQDKGIGIPKDQQRKIFDRLYQVTDAKEKTFPGLGLGLYISREIIRRHRGSIWVESEKDKGSTFYFAVPLK